MITSARDPISPTALRGAVTASGIVLLAAVVGAAVRLLPWALDPTIPWGTLAPFAKSLLSVAIEAAILVGWPVGWALAAQRLIERGEARVLESLGESPSRTVLRLAPQAAFFVALLAMTSVSLGREAAAPGRVVEALLTEGRTACLARQLGDDGTPATHAVPFVSATWLCADSSPRLVGRAPVGGAVFSASSAHVTDDLRRIDLADARLALAAPGAANSGLMVRVHVASLTLKGMAPWARASSLPPVLRALVVTSSGVVASCSVVFVLLRLRRKRIGGVAAAAVGASGPLAAIGALRGLELRVPEVAPGGWLLAFALVPLAAVLAVIASTHAATGLRRRHRKVAPPP